jgi:hypothetical protein
MSGRPAARDAGRVSGAEAGPLEHRFIFIGGLHRSGTSILFRCLREHPSISGFRDSGAPEDEGQHLQSVYPTAMAHGGPGRFGFRAAAHLTEESPLVSEGSRRRLFDEWKPYWDLARPYLLEKSPPNLIQARFLQALFPGAAFIMLLRHPVAVSYATRKWSKTPLGPLLRHWLVCHELLEADRGRLERLLVLRYEDFVCEPDATLAAIYRFLELEPRPATLEIAPDVNRKYFARWEKSRGNPVLRRYMRRLVDRYEERVARFGYSLSDLERS